MILFSASRSSLSNLYSGHIIPKTDLGQVLQGGEAHCAGATIETYGCHCIVETELVQLG